MTDYSSSANEVFYQAYLKRDRSFEGIFFLAVKTTGIFCRPGCSARAPKKSNVEFFQTATQALENGYRPCKKCQPLKPKGELPLWVSKAMQLVQQYNDQRISDSMLKQHSIDPVRLRRWFKSNYQLTFQHFQRMQRMINANNKIISGEKVIDSALDAGYQSLSGFNQTFKQLFGSSPSRAKNQTIITVAQLTTALGPMYAGASDKGICLLEFDDRKALHKQLARIQKKTAAHFVPGQHALLTQLQQQLDEYFERRRQQFELPLHFVGSDFQIRVWQALQKIPYGESRSYLQQAQMIHQPEAIRAVASANAANALAIVVPCHRVIAKSGGLAGYAGGIWRKQYLLKLEQNRDDC